MIHLVTLFPQHLNLNGDQGNLLALKKYLNLAGFETTVSVFDQNQTSQADFVLLGHGSMAAMDSIGAHLNQLNWEALLQVPGLAIGSGFEYLSNAGQVPQLIQKTERESQFEVGALGTVTVLGYRNTNSGLPNVAKNQQWICSMLHGPILAKNPKLLDLAAKAAVAHAGLDWPAENTPELKGWIANLNRMAANIWQIETETEFEPLAS